MLHMILFTGVLMSGKYGKISSLLLKLKFLFYLFILLILSLVFILHYNLLHIVLCQTGKKTFFDSEEYGTEICYRSMNEKFHKSYLDDLLLYVIKSY